MFALVRMVIQSNFPKSNKKRDVKKNPVNRLSGFQRFPVFRDSRFWRSFLIQ